MSDLRKSAISGRLSRLPHLPHMPPPPTRMPGSDEGDDEDDEHSEALDGLGSLSMHLPSRARKSISTSKHVPNPALAPLSASTHFSQAIQVAVPVSDLDFRVYFTPPIGGDTDSPGSIIVCHHGAGYSALSFACLAKEITAVSSGECGVLAFDARAHGQPHSCFPPLINPHAHARSPWLCRQNIFNI